MAVATLAFAACTDAPTIPRTDAREAGPASHVMPIDGGKPCDPWRDVNWCEDPGDDCLTSTGDEAGVQNCSGTPGGPGGGGPTVNPPAPDTACKTNDDAVLNDLAVQAGFEELWEQSGIDLEQSQRLESAAWIVQNPDGSHHLAPITYNQRDACGVNGNWFAPAGTIGFVHTHPFRSGEVMTACGPVTYEAPDGRRLTVIGQDGQPIYHRYNNQPSPRDRDLLTNVINRVRKARGEPGLRGYVIDNERITRYVNENGYKDTTYNRCGY